jgi:hypothetical protein
MVAHNFGDFQNLVYAEAVKGKYSRYPFDFQSIQRKASEALPDWVYRYVSAAAGTDATGEHCGVFALWNRAPDDGEPARA